MTNTVFSTRNFAPPAGPVMLSVPHAGRAYETAVVAQLRVPLAATLPLEDRFAEKLTEVASADGVPTIIANTPRLLIDLNRAPDDFDPESLFADRGHQPMRSAVPISAKARAGLGLIPTRLWGVGGLWRESFDPAEIAARIRNVHTPYHAAIAHALADARRRFGAAVLIDLHSMPALGGPSPADVVIGDRFGTSAAPDMIAAAVATLEGLGFRVAVNTPYAGGYVITRHAAPGTGIHAVQIEFDRRLYLDAALDKPGPGLVRLQVAITKLVGTLTQTLAGRFSAAAE